MRVLFLAMAVVLMASANVGAQQPAAPPCSGEAYRQLDFWVGTWDAAWEASPGQPAGHGTNVITRTLGDCVIEENFDGGPSTGNLIGRSVSIYHAPLGRWRQTWVDNQGGHFALIGGPVGDKFVLETAPATERGPYQRMVFENITPQAFTWRWQSTTDQGATWTDAWVIRYTKRAS